MVSRLNQALGGQKCERGREGDQERKTEESPRACKAEMVELYRNEKLGDGTPPRNWGRGTSQAGEV